MTWAFTFTYTFGWWSIPSAITAAGLIWALFFFFFFFFDNRGVGVRSGLSNMMPLIPVLTISCIAWAIAGALK